MEKTSDRLQRNPELLLSAAVDRLFLELLKYESIMDMNPEVLRIVQEASESATSCRADINQTGGEE